MENSKTITVTARIRPESLANIAHHLRMKDVNISTTSALVRSVVEFIEGELPAVFGNAKDGVDYLKSIGLVATVRGSGRALKGKVKAEGFGAEAYGKPAVTDEDIRQLIEGMKKGGQANG